MKRNEVVAVSYDKFLESAKYVKELSWVPEDFKESLLADVYTCYSLGDLRCTSGYELQTMMRRLKDRCINYVHGQKVSFKYTDEVYKKSGIIEVGLEGVDVVDDVVLEDDLDDCSASDAEIVDAMLHLVAGKSKLVNRLYRELLPLMNADDIKRYEGIRNEVEYLRSVKRANR